MKLFVTASMTMSVVAGVLVGSATARAQTNSGLKATVGVETVINRPTSRSSGSGVSTDLAPGETKRLNVTAGKGGDLCITGVFASESGTFPPDMQARIDRQQADALYVWSFDITMLEVAADRIVFDLAWERTSRSRHDDSLRRTERLTLREGESRAVDLIHSTQDGECMGVSLDVVAHIAEDLELDARTLEWDVWFNGAPSGPAHRALVTPHGDRGAFQFDPVPQTSTRPGSKTTLHVYGHLRGHIRGDGQLDVALTAVRFVNSGPRDRTRMPKTFRNAGASGQKNFIMKPGETIRIVLPPVNSTSPVQFQTDPLTGERRVTAVPRPTQSPGTPSANEMWITVRARVRE
jgi:hypothetical protein